MKHSIKNFTLSAFTLVVSLTASVNAADLVSKYSYSKMSATVNPAFSKQVTTRTSSAKTAESSTIRENGYIDSRLIPVVEGNLTQVEFTPESAAAEDEPVEGETVSAGDEINGQLNFLHDSDTYFIQIASEGLLEFKIAESRTPVQVKVRQNGENLLSFSSQGKRFRLRVSAGEYEVKVIDLGSFALNFDRLLNIGNVVSEYMGIPEYTIKTE